MTTPTEADVLAHYSTPGLRKREFTREAKKDWLSYAYPNMRRDEVDKLLDQLFGKIDDRAGPSTA